jgi:hypothetical protein
MAVKAKVEVTGLVGLVQQLKGPLFKNVNQELRHVAPLIAQDVVPHIRLAVSMSRAPQAHAMAGTVRVKRDRVPVVLIGKVNPKFQHSKFTRKGSDSARRRGSIAHGIIYGPNGGHQPPRKGGQNFYKIPRDDSGGALARTLEHGPAVRAATEAYLREFMQVMQRHGFIGSGDDVHWGGRD